MRVNQGLATDHQDLLLDRLELAEQRLLALTPAAKVGVWLWPDVTRDSMFIDESIRAAAGFPDDREWFTLAEAFDVVHPDDAPTLRAAMDAAVAAGGAFEVIHRLRPRDGAAFDSYVQVNGEAVHRAGRPALVRGTSRFIDDERAVSRERDRLLATLERIAATGGVQVWEWPAVHEDAVQLNGLLYARRHGRGGTHDGHSSGHDGQDGTHDGHLSTYPGFPSAHDGHHGAGDGQDGTHDGHPSSYSGFLSAHDIHRDGHDGHHDGPDGRHGRGGYLGGAKGAFDISWEALIHPDDLAGFRAEVTEAHRDPRTFEIEVRMSFDGEPYRWQLMQGTSERDRGSPHGLNAYGILVDIDDRRRYQQQLERAHEQLRLVTTGMSAGVWDWPDMDREEVYLSAELLGFLGYPAGAVEQTIGWTLGTIHPDDLARHGEALGRVRETGGRFVSEFRVRFYDGRYRWVRSAGMVSVEGHGGGRHRLTGALSDIHDRVTAERRLAETNQQLLNFADVVAHDLSAPLRHASAFVDILREDHGAALGEPGRGYLDRIARAVGQSEAMITDLLEYSRSGTSALRRERVDLGELCGELRDRLSVGGQAAHVTWDIGPIPTVIADRTHMLMLFQNLLANAVKFTATTPGARVEVFAGEGGEGERVIVVRDNGVGFDQTYDKHIFGAFARAHTRSEFAGTGIGLANVARIVARHDGRIEAKGEVGQGAMFTVFLPTAALA